MYKIPYCIKNKPITRTSALQKLYALQNTLVSIKSFSSIESDAQQKTYVLIKFNQF